LIILDTNVVSEPMRPTPDHRVSGWIDRQNAEDLYLTAISLAELLVGVITMPAGKRRDRLEFAVNRLEHDKFLGRILPFDDNAAHAYAMLQSETRARGTPVEGADAEIAAIALAHGCPIATRDTTPFLTAGLKVINPWTD
jgi:predicted nucleic acid-binding protein